MKNALPLLLYLVVVGGGIFMLSNAREKSRMAPISFSKKITEDYYLYVKTEKLAYISTENKKNEWGAETIQPSIYEMALYNDFILTKAHPLSQGQELLNERGDKGNRLTSAMLKQIKLDTNITIYTLYNTRTKTINTVSEWALFEKELANNQVPLNVPFTKVNTLK
jgi:hypothetical protein